MRIVYVSPVGVLGGAEQCLLNVMASVRRTDPSVEQHLIASTDGPLLARTRELGVEAHLVEMPSNMAELGESILHRGKNLKAAIGLASRAASVFPRTSRYVLRLRGALKKLGPDVIHSNGLKAHLLTALARPRGMKLVWHIHDFIAARPAMGRALRLASQRADGAVAISTAVATDARRVLPQLPITTVFNAIDVARFCPATGDGARLDRLANLPAAPAGILRIGLVATFARWKGQDVLLEAAAHLRRDHPGHSLRFYIIGGPIYRTRGSQFSEDELRARAAGLGIADCVGFVPFQHDTPAVYRDLDVVVHASTEPEPFGLTIVEAMACGRPVIISKAGGAAEIFADDVDALGVPPGDSVALAKAIARLVDSEALRRRLSDAAVQTAQTRFCHQRFGREMLDVYERARVAR